VLSIAPSAAAAINALVSSRGLPDTAGLRLVLAEDDSRQPRLEVHISEAPDEGDQVVVEQSAHVFVDARIVDDVDDRTLEATISDDDVLFRLAGSA
jgi:Fe-S cluster assembly iron-binding protein IscA